MKICVLQSVLDPYKGGNHLSLFGALSNVEFTIVCNRSKARTEDLPPNVTVVTIPGRIGSYYYGVMDFLFARTVIKAYPSSSDFWRQFDVIHLNQVMGPAFAKLKKTGTPLLFLIHHPVTADRQVSGWFLKYILLVRFQKKICDVVDRIATVSHTMKKRIATDYACSEKKIVVVPNGVDGDRFTFASDNECIADVVTVGSFVHPRKGFSYLLEVYRELTKYGFTISDVGRRSEQQLVALKEIEGVSVFGTVDEQELVNHVRRSRVLVSTSQYEGFGLSLIEALACGHPAFAFAVGAIPEVLEPIDPHLVVQPNDTAELSKRIKEYLALSSDTRDENGRRYRESALSRFGIESSAEELRKVYTELSKTR